MNEYWKKSTNESKRKPEQNLMRVLEQFLELVSGFKEACRNFIFIFHFNKAG
jgi:hypothetical protein